MGMRARSPTNRMGALIPNLPLLVGVIMTWLIRTIIFVVFFMLYGAAHWYIWARLVRDTRLPPLVSKMLTGLIIFMGASIPAFGMLWRFIRHTRFGVLSLFMIWSIVVLYLLVFLGVGELVRFVIGRVSKARIPEASEITAQTDDTPPDSERRLFFTRTMAAATAGAAVAVVGQGVHAAVAGPRLFKVDIPLERLSPHMDGTTIVQISDIHVGRGVGREYVRNVVARVNALNPDMVVITGDLVDGPVSALGSAVAELGALKSKYGTFFVPGNHDYYAGLGPWIRFLREMNVRVLMNDHVRIGEGDAWFALAGVDDRAGAIEMGGPNVKQALSGLSSSREVVLLSHRPGVIYDAARAGVGVMLCGHTHGGGQI